MRRSSPLRDHHSRQDRQGSPCALARVRVQFVARIREEESDDLGQGRTCRTLVLAEAQGLTLCDAACLELAPRLALPLALLDRELCQAAAGFGVELLGQAA
jgi:hypothetical protein